MTAAQAVERIVSQRVTSENERGVDDVSTNHPFAHVRVSLSSPSPRASQELAIYRPPAENALRINRLMHHVAPCFLIDALVAQRAATLIEKTGDLVPVTPSRRRVGVPAGSTRYLCPTALMAPTLDAMGLQTIPFTGGQTGSRTDYALGDARSVIIDRRDPLPLFCEGGYDGAAVASLQATTGPRGGMRQGATTRFGRGGSDTTASALDVALWAGEDAGRAGPARHTRFEWGT